MQNMNQGMTTYRKHILMMMATIMCIMCIACGYDEHIEVCEVAVRLTYPENSIRPYPGARVEMKDAVASIFVDSTDATGTAHFTLPPGIYEATSSDQYVDSTTNEWWRYIFNGVRSMIIVSPDSTNQILLDLKMSKKRIVH